MSMPTATRPRRSKDFYLYLQGHQQTTHPVQTWHVDWMSLAWLWGFVVVIVVVLAALGQAVPDDEAAHGHLSGGQLRRLDDGSAGPATGFFLLFTAIVVGFAVALIVGHIVWGQKF